MHGQEKNEFFFSGRLADIHQYFDHECQVRSYPVSWHHPFLDSCATRVQQTAYVSTEWSCRLPQIMQSHTMYLGFWLTIHMV